MILAFVSLVLAALVALVVLPILFVYTESSFFLLVAGFLITAFALLCWTGHVHGLVFEFLKHWRRR